MYFSQRDEQIMRNLFKAIHNNKNEVYTLAFPNGDIVEAKVDTCFETDNGLEEDNPNFEEYNACAMLILRLIRDKSKTLKPGVLFEVNYHNYPKIFNSKGEKI